MRIREIMAVPPPRIRSTANLQQAAEMVALSGISDLMVVDEEGTFLGVLSEGDILRSALPDMDEAIEAGGTLEAAFDVFLQKGRTLSNRSILPLIIRDPIVVRPDDHVTEATVILVDRMIRRLPVVEDGRLVGTVSRADVCRTVVGML